MSDAYELCKRCGGMGEYWVTRGNVVDYYEILERCPCAIRTVIDVRPVEQAKSKPVKRGHEAGVKIAIKAIKEFERTRKR